MYCTRANQNEFKDVFRTGDATESDDWNVDSIGNLPDATERDRLDAWTRESSYDVCKTRFSGLKINSHTDQGIDTRNRVCASIFYMTSDIGDICHIGRELDYDMFVKIRLFATVLWNAMRSFTVKNRKF